MLACVCDYDRPMDSYTSFRILKEGTSQSRHTSNCKVMNRGLPWWPGEISITSDMQMTSPLWQKMKKN